MQNMAHGQADDMKTVNATRDYIIHSASQK